MGLTIFDYAFPIGAGILGLMLAVRGAILDRGHWRALSVLALGLSLTPYHLGRYCFWAAVRMGEYVLSP